MRLDEGLPWCPACDWNLAAWDPLVRPARGSRGLERRGHVVADRIDGELYEELSRARPTTPTAAPGFVAVVALYWLLVVAMAVAGVWLLVAAPSFWLVNLGVLLIVVAVLLRPRFGLRPRKRRRLDRTDAPALFELLDTVAAALDVPVPEDVVLDLGARITLDTRGLRRRAVLELGGRLWTTLTPGARVAALAHELSQLGSGDPYRGPWARPVLRAADALVVATQAERTTPSILRSHRRGVPYLVIIGRLLLRPFARVALTVHTLAHRAGQRAHRRAAYFADSRTASVAGRDATLALLDRYLLSADIDRLIHHVATRRAIERWPEAVAAYVDGRAEDLTLLRRHDARHAGLWDDHPPAGRRGRMVLAWPTTPARVRLTAAESARIDGQLAPWIAAVAREIIGARDFGDQGSPAAG
ncbi:MAG TPA: hypothetical protein VGH43_12420 [Jatrophihabitans sp.]